MAGDTKQLTSLPLWLRRRKETRSSVTSDALWRRGSITIENQSDIPLYDSFIITSRLRGVCLDDTGRYGLVPFLVQPVEITTLESTGYDIENEWDSNDQNRPDPEFNYCFLRSDWLSATSSVWTTTSTARTPIWYGEGGRHVSSRWRVSTVSSSAHGTGTEDYFNQSWSPDEHYYTSTSEPWVWEAERLSLPCSAGMGRTHVYRLPPRGSDPVQEVSASLIEQGHGTA